MKRRFRSIQSELLKWFILIALIPMGTIGWYGYHEAANSIKLIQKNAFDKVEKANVKAVHMWFNDIEEDLQAWATLPAPRRSFEAVLKGWKSSGKSLSDYLSTQEYKQAIEYGDVAMKNLQSHYDYAYDILLISKEGDVVYSIKQEDEYKSNLRFGKHALTKFAQAFRETLIDEKSHFSDLEYYAPSKGMLSGFVTVPMYDDNGQLLGVMALQVNMQALLSTFDQASTLNTIRHYLVGADGLLRSKREGHNILEERISTELFWNWQNIHANHSANAGEAILKDTILYLGPNGEEVLGKYHEISVLGIHWVHISEISVEEFYAPLYDLAKTIIIMIVLGIGIVIVSARILSKRLTEPIVTLREASRAYASGEEKFEFVINAENEIGELAHAFSDMVARQQKSAKDLSIIAMSEKVKSSELAKSLEVKRAILDAAGVMIVTAKPDGTILTLNKAGEGMTGYPQEEVVNQLSLINFHKEDELIERAAQLSRELEAVIQPGLEVLVAKCNRGLPNGGEWTYRRKDGSEFSAYATITALRDQNGQIFSYLGVVADISSIKEAQEEVRRLSQVVGQSPYPIFITDADAKIQYINGEVLRISGYGVTELVGQPMSIFNSGKHSEFVYQSLWERIAIQQKVWHGTFINRMKNGDFRDWDSTIFPLFNTQGEVSSYVSIVNDVTEANAKERLLMMQSRQAQMGEMLSMIAHQWRQPLAIINALVGKILLQEMFKDNPDEGLSEVLKQIEDQSLFLSRTITDFRDFFRVDKPKEDVACSKVVQNAINLIDHAIKTHSLHLTITSHQDPIINTYANEVIQVIITLIKNSLDAFDEHDVESKTLDIIIDQEENYAAITIKDNAGGIEPEIMQDIFTPYFTTKIGDKGTGLGLYMAKTVVEEHCHGLLRVYSEDGTTLFRIFLPLHNE